MPGEDGKGGWEGRKRRRERYRGRVRRILGGRGGGHVPMINTFDLDGTGAPRFVNMFNLYENAAIDQIIDRVARTNSGHQPNRTNGV